MTSSFKQRILSKANQIGARIILPEQNDSRVIEASAILKKLGFNILDIKKSNDSLRILKDSIASLKFTDNWTHNQLDVFLKKPLNLGMAMLANDMGDSLIAGATMATSDVIRAAIRIIGVKPDTKWVSSIFLMIPPNTKSILTYADCAVIPEPSAEQLVSIAKNAADFHELLLDISPRVAFLSFSTKGSASHYRVKKVSEAQKIFAKKYTNIINDGELQFDVAIDAMIASKKASISPIQGDANVMIFPNLDAGNISYKITQRLAGYSALGPLLQGFNKPVHDLSRGCSVDDIVLVSAISAIQKDFYANI